MARKLTAGNLLAFAERALRGGHNVFFDLLQQAAENAVEAAVVLHELLVAFPDRAELVDRIAELEGRGDDVVHEVMDRVNRELVTPIEDDDLFTLVSALDDVVDFVDDVAAHLALYSVEAPMIQAQALANVLVDATRELAQAVRLTSRFRDISAHVDAVHRLENEGDRLARDAVASLFEEGIDPMVVIRWKDIFEWLEDAIDATKRTAYALQSVVIKNA